MDLDVGLLSDRLPNRCQERPLIVWEGYFEICELRRYAKALNEAQIDGCMAIRGRPSLAGTVGEPQPYRTKRRFV